MGVDGLLTLWLLDTLRDRSLAGEETREVGLGRVWLDPFRSNVVGVALDTGDPQSNLTNRLACSGVPPLGRLPLLLALLWRSELVRGGGSGTTSLTPWGALDGLPRGSAMQVRLEVLLGTPPKM